jgi:hypothetical protein
MTRFKIKVILFLTMIFSLNTPAFAFNQKGMVKIPGSVLSKGTTGVLREICLDKLVFVTYGSRGDSAAVQLTDGNKPLRCENTTLTVRKQYPVPSTMLDKSDTGVIRTFEISGRTIALFATKNGGASLLQIAE